LRRWTADSRRFEDNVRVLRDAFRTLAEDVRTGQFVASAAEWLLDNFYLVTTEIADIRRNLPPATFVSCLRWPRASASGTLAFTPSLWRSFAIATVDWSGGN
jgi:hypothetical protein